MPHSCSSLYCAKSDQHWFQKCLRKFSGCRSLSKTSTGWLCQDMMTMCRGVTGASETIAGSKIEPLDSKQKAGVEHALTGRGAAGPDTNIDQARIDPLGGAGRWLFIIDHFIVKNGLFDTSSYRTASTYQTSRRQSRECWQR